MAQELNKEKILLVSVLDQIIILAKEMREDAILSILLTLKGAIIKGEQDLALLATTCNVFAMQCMLRMGLNPEEEIRKFKEKQNKISKN